MVEYAVKNIKEVKFTILPAARKAGKPVLIVGATGIGKTAIVEEFAKEHNLPFKKFKPGDMEDVGDLLGKIIVKDGKSQFTYTDWFPEKENTVFLIDEVNRCNPFIQQALFEVIQYKTFNGRPLPKGTFIVMTANIQEGKDNYIVIEMDDAFIERSAKVKLVPKVEEVLEYGVKQGWDERLLMFFSIYNQHMKLDTDTMGVPPRAIEDCSEMMKAGLPIDHIDVYVGAEVAAAIKGFVESDYKKIPKYDELKKNPTLVKQLPKDQYGLLYFYTSRIISECMDKQTYHPLAGHMAAFLADKFPDIFTGTLAMHDNVDIHNFLSQFKREDPDNFEVIKEVIEEYRKSSCKQKRS